MSTDIEVIETLERLDEKLRELDGLALVSDDSLRRGFETFRMNFPMPSDLDPYSDEYREHQFKLYETISGRNYAVKNEVAAFDVAAASIRPFPYTSESPSTVGHQLIAIGFLISLLPSRTPERPLRILEFGPGWGNTTLAMATMGYNVTAIDIAPGFCELIRTRADMLGIEVDVVNGDFSLIEDVVEPYDAVVFFECFHHSSDHLRLLRSLAAATTPEARVLFAAEPIVADFPVPWGLRLDGESLWAARNFGWLELGFNQTYFEETVKRCGWDLVNHRLDGTPWANVWLAQKEPTVLRLDPSQSTFHTQVGEYRDGAMYSDGTQGFLQYGPYQALESGRYQAVVDFFSLDGASGLVAIDVVSSSGSVSHGRLEIQVDHMQQHNAVSRLEFTLAAAVADLELRVFVTAGTRVALRSSRILPLPAE